MIELEKPDLREIWHSTPVVIFFFNTNLYVSLHQIKSKVYWNKYNLLWIYEDKKWMNEKNKICSRELFSCHTLAKKLLFFASLGSILDFQLSWKSGKFLITRWNHKVVKFNERTSYQPTLPHCFILVVYGGCLRHVWLKGVVRVPRKVYKLGTYFVWPKKFSNPIFC